MYHCIPKGEKMNWKKPIPIFKLFISPTKYFEELNEQPKWLAVFIIIALLSIVEAYLLLPFKQEVLLSSLSEKVGVERAQETLSVANQFVLIGLLFIPIPLAIKLVAITTIIFYSAILFNAQNPNFKKLFTVTVHAEVIFLLMGIANIIGLEFNGVNSLRNHSIWQTIVGLDDVFKDSPPNIYLSTILNSFNLFSIWYLVVLTIGVSVSSRLERWKSSIMVSLLWTLGISFQIALKYISVTIQHMMGQ
jgi:hypothetical protein